MRKLNDILKLGFTPLNYGQVTQVIVKMLNKPMPRESKEPLSYDLPAIEKTYLEGMVEAMIHKALSGDPRCFEILVNRVEGTPVQQPNMVQLMALLSAVPPEVLAQMLDDYQLQQDERRLLDCSDGKAN